MTIDRKASVVLSSNAVFTGLHEEPIAACIAVADNTIVAIGSKQEIEPWIGPETQIYRYDDKLIMPGFHDFHLHVMFGAVADDSAYLLGARSEQHVAQLVREFADSRPDDPWILGFSWDWAEWENKELPTRASLDVVLPNRPVMLFHVEGHYVWVNSKALEILHIDRNIPQPPYGEI